MSRVLRCRRRRSRRPMSLAAGRAGQGATYPRGERLHTALGTVARRGHCPAQRTVPVHRVLRAVIARR